MQKALLQADSTVAYWALYLAAMMDQGMAEMRAFQRVQQKDGRMVLMKAVPRVLVTVAMVELMADARAAMKGEKMAAETVASWV